VTWFVLAVGAAFAAYVHFNHPAWIGRDLIETVNASAWVQQLSPPASKVPEAVAAPAPPVENAAAPDPEDAAGVKTEKAADAPVATAEDNSAPPIQARAIQIVLTAHEPAWVEVVADGKTAFSGTLQPNDSRSIAADALVKLVTGNAGGIGISLNGKTLDPIGPPGQVRTVKLTAEGLQFVQTPPTAPDPL
jgi:hypothetical protein